MTNQLLLLPATEPGMSMSASISPCGRYRWTLGRVWDDRLPVLLWIMLNPSRADHAINDPTILRVMHFSRAWGFGAATVVNLLPYRSSSPAECRRWADADDEETINRQLENMLVISREAQHAGAIVAAWGATPWARPIGDEIMLQCRYVNGRELLCLGTTADCSPKHPLARGLHRVPDDQKPVVWRR